MLCSIHRNESNTGVEMIWETKHAEKRSCSNNKQRVSNQALLIPSSIGMMRARVKEGRKQVSSNSLTFPPSIARLPLCFPIGPKLGMGSRGRLGL